MMETDKTLDEKKTNPNERMTAKQVCQEFNIKTSTLASWRRYLSYDGRYPRFHKLFTGKIFYVRSEIEEDLKNMEVDVKQGYHRWRS